MIQVLNSIGGLVSSMNLLLFNEKVADPAVS